MENVTEMMHGEVELRQTEDHRIVRTLALFFGTITIPIGFFLSSVTLAALTASEEKALIGFGYVCFMAVLSFIMVVGGSWAVVKNHNL